MKKRLRKKLKLKDFAELGFRIIAKFDPGITPDDHKKLLDDFLTFTIDDNQLSCGGCSDDDQMEMFITTIKGRAATENHRQMINKWLKDRSEIKEVTLGELEKARQ